MNDDDEKSLFMSEIEGIDGLRKLASERRANLDSNDKNLILDPNKEGKRLAAQGLSKSNSGHLLSLPPKNIGPFDEMSFKEQGVQNGVFRKLKQGKYPIEAKLDLHRLTMKEAVLAVERFLADSLKRNFRTVLIAHGKGDKSPEPAKLKKHLASWLEVIDEVIAFNSAQLKDGGVGAVYVMLKKSDNKKMENKERFQNR